MGTKRKVVVLVNNAPAPYRVRRFSVFGKSSHISLFLANFRTKNTIALFAKVPIFRGFQWELSDKKYHRVLTTFIQKVAKEENCTEVVGRRIPTAHVHCFLVRNIRYQAAPEMSIEREKGNGAAIRKIKRGGKEIKGHQRKGKEKKVQGKKVKEKKWENKQTKTKRPNLVRVSL